MFDILSLANDRAYLTNQQISFLNAEVSYTLLKMDSWEMKTACMAVLGHDTIPHEFTALIREAVASHQLSLLMDKLGEENLWQFDPRTFLLWCRKNSIALRKPLSLWLDADTLIRSSDTSANSETSGGHHHVSI